MDKKGLTTSEAKLKLAEAGPNELPSKKTYSVLKLLSAQFKNLLIWLLIFASLLSFLFPFLSKIIKFTLIAISFALYK